MAHIVMACIVMAYVGMAHIVMAYIVMASIAMADIVLADVVMAEGRHLRCRAKQRRPHHEPGGPAALAAESETAIGGRP